MSDDLIVRAKRTAVGLRTWDHPNEANLMEDLADEIRDLREQLEMREDLLLRAGRDNLRLHRIVEQARRYVDGQAKHGIHADCNPTVSFGMDVGESITWFYNYLRGVDQSAREEARRVLETIDGAPDPRRVETTEWTVGCPIGGVWIPYGSPPHQSREGAYNQAVRLACTDEARGWEVRSRTVTAWLPEVSS